MAYPGFGLALGSVALHKGQMPNALLLCMIGVVLFFAAALLVLFKGRCLQCDRRLGQMFSQQGGTPWRISADLCFCPYCGHSLDEPSPDNRPA